MRFKILVSTVVLAISGYSAFWFYLAGQVEDRTLAWIKTQESKGLKVYYDDLTVTGYPYKIVVRMTSAKGALRPLSDPNRQFAFETPEIAVIAHLWKLSHAVVVTDYLDMTTGRSYNTDAFQLALEKVKSSIILNRDDWRPERVSVVADQASWVTENHLSAEAPSVAHNVEVHMRRPVTGSQGPKDDLEMQLPVYADVYFKADDITALELPVDTFGKKADMVKIDGALHATDMLKYNRQSLSDWRDAGGTISLRDVEIKSGPMDVKLQGDVALDQMFNPLGAFSAEVRGIDHIVKILSRHPGFRQEPGSLLLDELKNMVQSSPEGTDKRLDLSISLQNGFVFLGPLPVYETGKVIE